MALPKFVEFFRPFLEAVSDGDTHVQNIIGALRETIATKKLSKKSALGMI
ncbi:hypothetical protein [Butyrivibrio sp. AE3004]|nr:hypothetical protein [Butyrivibrio sp. AE3004]